MFCVFPDTYNKSATMFSLIRKCCSLINNTKIFNPLLSQFNRFLLHNIVVECLDFLSLNIALIAGLARHYRSRLIYPCDIILWTFLLLGCLFSLFFFFVAAKIWIVYLLQVRNYTLENVTNFV